MNQQKFQNQLKNEDHEQVGGGPYSDIPEWLLEFRENLVEERVLEHRDSICGTFKISCLMGRRSMKDVSGNHLKDLLFHLVHWLSITLKLRKTSQESINLERKYYLEYPLDTLCTRGEFG